jgi:IS1 family transposase
LVFYPEKKTLSEKDLEQEFGRTWIWAAIDPESKLLIYHAVGKRTLDVCRVFFDGLLKRLSNKPLFTSDELPHYETVLFENFHLTQEVVRTGKRGRPRNPIKVIDPELNYAVVHKTREKGKMIKVEKKVIFGSQESVEDCLERSVSKTINTSYIERFNLTLRQNDAHLQRKTLKFSKNISYFEAKLNIVIMHYNFIKPHWSLSKSMKKPVTPAMKANIVSSKWSVNDACSYPIL